MALKMSPQDISQVQQGMADRADSVPTLKLINVPTQIIAGEEERPATLADAETMKTHISGSSLAIIPKAETMPLTKSPKKSACCCDNLSMPIAKPTLVVAKFQDKLPTYSRSAVQA